MVAVPIRYSPKDKKASPLLIDLGARKFSLYPNRLNYLDEADWQIVKSISRFAPLIKSGELLLSDKKAHIVAEIESVPQVEQTVEAKQAIKPPDRIPPKKE